MEESWPWSLEFVETPNEVTDFKVNCYRNHGLYGVAEIVISDNLEITVSGAPAEDIAASIPDRVYRMLSCEPSTDNPANTHMEYPLRGASVGAVASAVRDLLHGLSWAWTAWDRRYNAIRQALQAAVDAEAGGESE